MGNVVRQGETINRWIDEMWQEFFDDINKRKYMTKQHKWHKEIKAWADGAKIEYQGKSGDWYVDNDPLWLTTCEYRIKPQPEEPKYLYLYRGTIVGVLYFDFEQVEGRTYIGKIKLEDDDGNT